MEIKATLKQPYTENERTDFIQGQVDKYGMVEVGKGVELELGITRTKLNQAIYALEAWELLEGNEVIDNTEAWEAEQAQKERQRLDQLALTPSDVERALYYSPLQMDFNDLKALIAEKAPQIDLKGLAIEFRANNFYRGAVDKNGNRIIDMVGAILGYTPEDMDYLFEHKQLPVHEEEPVTEPVVEPEATTEEPVTEPTAEETVEE